MKNVECVCDGCGRTVMCGFGDEAPLGWYYAVAHKHAPSMSDPNVTVCSKKCQATLNWKRVAR